MERTPAGIEPLCATTVQVWPPSLVRTSDSRPPTAPTTNTVDEEAEPTWISRLSSALPGRNVRPPSVDTATNDTAAADRCVHSTLTDPSGAVLSAEASTSPPGPWGQGSPR